MTSTRPTSVAILSTAVDIEASAAATGSVTGGTGTGTGGGGGGTGGTGGGGAGGAGGVGPDVGRVARKAVYRAGKPASAPPWPRADETDLHFVEAIALQRREQIAAAAASGIIVLRQPPTVGDLRLWIDPGKTGGGRAFGVGRALELQKSQSTGRQPRGTGAAWPFGRRGEMIERAGPRLGRAALSP